MATKLSDFLGHTVNVPDTFPTDVTFASGVKETKETLSGTSVNLDPSTGTIKLHTLTGNTTYTESLRSGEYVTLVIEVASYTITWPTMVWTNNGGAAPDLTVNDFTFVTIWKVGSVLYGSLIGVNTRLVVAYVACSLADSLTSIDISNPSSLSQLDSFTSAGLDGAFGVAVDSTNGVAYVAANQADSVVAIDISNPSSLAELSTLTTPELEGSSRVRLDPVNSIAYVMSAKFVTDRFVGRLTSIDISDPSNLVQLDSFTSAGLDNARNFDIDPTNGVACVLGYNDAVITSIDISNPSSLAQLDTFTSTDLAGPNAVAIDTINNVAYVAARNADRLVAIDISNPSNLAQLDSFTSAALDGPMYLALDTTNGVAYVVSTLHVVDTITSIDISNPSSLVQLDSLASSAIDRPEGISLDLINGVAYVVSGDSTGSITSIDISNPSALSQLDTCTSADLSGRRAVALG